MHVRQAYEKGIISSRLLATAQEHMGVSIKAEVVQSTQQIGFPPNGLSQLFATLLCDCYFVDGNS